MYRKFLCYVVALSTALISHAFTLNQGNIYFDNSNALWSHVTMLCQGSNSQTEVVSMRFDPESGLYKATIKPSFEQYTSIGFINQEVADTIVDKEIKDYVEELRVIYSPATQDPSLDETSSENDEESSDENPSTNPEEEHPGNSQPTGLGEEPVEEEPTEELVYIGEISFQLPFRTDNVFVPYLSQSADICGNWTPLHPEQFTPSGQLPILYVNTEGSQRLECKAKNLNATYYFDAMGNEDCVSIGSAEAPLPTKIKGRGNSTWRNLAKKPYKLKLDKAASFFNLPKSKHWALMAHAMGPLDWVTNASAFNLANNMDFGWHPHLYPIELVFNGEYQGVYFLCETIKVSEGRLEIFEQKDQETDPDVIPGGWLVEIDNYSEEGQVNLMEGDMSLLVTPHSPEELSKEQFQWLSDEFSYITSEIHIPYDKCPIWMEDIDPYYMAKYFVIQEIFDNPDGFNGSFYLHKDQGTGQKWQAGPLWDISSYTRQKTDWTIKMDAGYKFHTHWIGEMLKYPDFLAIVRDEFRRVEKMMPQLYQYNLDYAANVSRGIESNYSRWPAYNTENPVDLANRLNRFLSQNVLHFQAKLEEVFPTTAIQDIESAQTITINLNGNEVNIPSLEQVSIEVFDLTGRKTASAIGNQITIPTSGLAIIKVTSANETLIQKVLVK